MSTCKIKVISWHEAQELLQTKDKSKNRELLGIISEIGQFLKSDNSDYVYHARLGFGDNVIVKGKIAFENPGINSGLYKKKKEDFKNDVQYSNDPLGIVLSNHLEVFTENRSYGDNGGLYTFPLNILEAGDLFGLFGTLDMFLGIEDKSIRRDWYVRAGNVSFRIAFPFHNAEVKVIHEQKFNHLSERRVPKDEAIPGDNKVNFIKEFVKDWFVDIAYFPKHFFESIPDELKIRFKNLMFKIGWEQSAHLRNAAFEDTAIFNVIENTKSKHFYHDKIFLNVLYHYLNKASSGKSLILKPLLDDHVIRIAIEQFKSENKNYFKLEKSLEPLPFIWDNSWKEQEWGVVSIDQLPIIFNYHIESLNLLLKDIELINKKIENNFQLKGKYRLMELDGYGNTGGKGSVKVKKTEVIRELFAEAFKLETYKINLNCKDFSNLIIIKNGNK